MGSNRLGAGANLTPNQARDRLAVPCLLVLLDAAKVDFVLSYSGAQARPVYIRRTARTAPVAKSIPQLQQGLQFFTVALNWEQYDKAVRPVLSDPRFDMTTPLSKTLLATGNVRDLVSSLGEALRLSFIAAGYGPAD